MSVVKLRERGNPKAVTFRTINSIKFNSLRTYEKFGGISRSALCWFTSHMYIKL